MLQVGRYVYEACLFSLLNPIRKKNVLDDSQNTHHMLQLLPFTYNHSMCTHAVHWLYVWVWVRQLNGHGRIVCCMCTCVMQINRRAWEAGLIAPQLVGFSMCCTAKVIGGGSCLMHHLVNGIHQSALCKIVSFNLSVNLSVNVFFPLFLSTYHRCNLVR